MSLRSKEVYFNISNELGNNLVNTLTLSGLSKLVLSQGDKIPVVIKFYEGKTRNAKQVDVEASTVTLTGRWSHNNATAIDQFTINKNATGLLRDSTGTLSGEFNSTSTTVGIGQGYAEANDYTITQGDNQSATLTVQTVDENGGILTSAITNGGTGYTTDPVTIENPLGVDRVEPDTTPTKSYAALEDIDAAKNENALFGLDLSIDETKSGVIFTSGNTGSTITENESLQILSSNGLGYTQDSINPNPSLKLNTDATGTVFTTPENTTVEGGVSTSGTEYVHPSSRFANGYGVRLDGDPALHDTSVEFGDSNGTTFFGKRTSTSGSGTSFIDTPGFTQNFEIPETAERLVVNFGRIECTPTTPTSNLVGKLEVDIVLSGANVSHFKLGSLDIYEGGSTKNFVLDLSRYGSYTGNNINDDLRQAAIGLSVRYAPVLESSIHIEKFEVKTAQLPASFHTLEHIHKPELDSYTAISVKAMDGYDTAVDDPLKHYGFFNRFTFDSEGVGEYILKLPIAVPFQLGGWSSLSTSSNSSNYLSFFSVDYSSSPSNTNSADYVTAHTVLSHNLVNDVPVWTLSRTAKNSYTESIADPFVRYIDYDHIVDENERNEAIRADYQKPSSRSGLLWIELNIPFYGYDANTQEFWIDYQNVVNPNEWDDSTTLITSRTNSFNQYSFAYKSVWDLVVTPQFDNASGFRPPAFPFTIQGGDNLVRTWHSANYVDRVDGLPEDNGDITNFINDFMVAYSGWIQTNQAQSPLSTGFGAESEQNGTMQHIQVFDKPLQAGSTYRLRVSGYDVTGVVLLYNENYNRLSYEIYDQTNTEPHTVKTNPRITLTNNGTYSYIIRPDNEIYAIGFNLFSSSSGRISEISLQELNDYAISTDVSYDFQDTTQGDALVNQNEQYEGSSDGLLLHDIGSRSIDLTSEENEQRIINGNSLSNKIYLVQDNLDLSGSSSLLINSDYIADYKQNYNEGYNSSDLNVYVEHPSRGWLLAKSTTLSATSNNIPINFPPLPAGESFSKIAYEFEADKRIFLKSLAIGEAAQNSVVEVTNQGLVVAVQTENPSKSAKGVIGFDQLPLGQFRLNWFYDISNKKIKVWLNNELNLELFLPGGFQGDVWGSTKNNNFLEVNNESNPAETNTIYNGQVLSLLDYYSGLTNSDVTVVNNDIENVQMSVVNPYDFYGTLSLDNNNIHSFFDLGNTEGNINCDIQIANADGSLSYTISRFVINVLRDINYDNSNASPYIIL